MIPARDAAEVHERISSSVSSTTAGKGCDRCTEKQMQVLRELCARVHNKKGSNCITADISQSKHIRFGLGGVCPTFARSSKIVIVSDASSNTRFLSALDALLLHSFPAHEMRVPDSVSESALRQLVGNTQHVQAIAAAELLAMCMVNWSRSTDLTNRFSSEPMQPKLDGRRAFLVLRWTNGMWVPKSVKKITRKQQSKQLHKRISEVKVKQNKVVHQACGIQRTAGSGSKGTTATSVKRKLVDLFKSY